jgi:hypothetical protein
VIEKTILARFDPIGEADAFLAAMEQFAPIGIDHVHFSAPVPDPEGWVTEHAERIVSRLAELGA